MAAPAQTTSDVPEPTVTADPIALAAFVSRRSGRVLAYLDAVTAPSRALDATAEAFASYRLARAADPDAEAPATTLLRATRRAAAAHAENPFRPDGRERSATRTNACAAMPRLLIAWTEARLPEPDVARLVEHLQGCPDCRALRDAFDRAELGYRAGESTDPDATEVGVITTAMARAGGAPEPVAPLRRDEQASVPATPVRDANGPDRGGSPEDTGATSSSRSGKAAAAPSSASVAASSASSSSPEPPSSASPGSTTTPASSSASTPSSSVPPRRRRTSIPAAPSAAAARSASTGAASSGPVPASGGATGAPADRGDAPRTPAARRAAAGRRTEIPAPPARRRTAIPARPARSGLGGAAAADVDAVASRAPRRTDRPADRDVPSGHEASDAVRAVSDTPVDGTGSRPSDRTALPDRSRPTASGTSSGGSATTSRSSSSAEPPEDPLGPEALGYAVPRSGLPRAPRRPAVPRVRRRRGRRAPSAAVVAAAAATQTAAARDADPTTDVAHTATGAAAAHDTPTSTTTGVGSRTPDAAAEPTRTKTEIARERAAEAAAEREAAALLRAEEREAAERDAEAAGTPEDREQDDRGGSDDAGSEAGRAERTAEDDRAREEPPGTVADRPTAAAGIVPATVTERTGVAGVGRRALDTPLVRQLGVPAVLLLVVLIGALIAAGAFAGRDEESVAPVTRPTIPTVPADPSEIPPLR